MHLLCQPDKDGRQDGADNDFICHVSLSYLSTQLVANTA